MFWERLRRRAPEKGTLDICCYSSGIYTTTCTDGSVSSGCNISIYVPAAHLSWCVVVVALQSLTCLVAAFRVQKSLPSCRRAYQLRLLDSTKWETVKIRQIWANWARLPKAELVSFSTPQFNHLVAPKNNHGLRWESACFWDTHTTITSIE